jgi:5-(carboxyamino)imidazole ribonucleotide synthase
MGLPSPKFLECTGDKESFLERCAQEFNGKCVLKWATLGYDGKGVKICRAKEDILNSTEFCDIVLRRNGGLFAEELIEFDRELACVGVRDKNGVTETYPVVVSEQDNGICFRVYGPAEQVGVPEKTANKVREIVKEIGNRAEIIGAFGVEFFEKNGEVFINEIAPRVHNTGHYTQDACFTSQFENHIRAVLGMNLGSTAAFDTFLMQNILGDKGKFVYPDLDKTLHLHWYNKSEKKPRRKLGHINGVGEIVKLKSKLAELVLFK